MKNTLIFILEILKIVIIALVIVVPIRYFVFQPFFVRGQSMEPSFHNGDYLIIDEISYRFRGPQRGEVIVFKYPSDPSQRYIKRVIGLPEETVEIKDGKVNVYDKNGILQNIEETLYLVDMPTTGNVNIHLGEKEYFVLGDNRLFSSDSRRWGSVPQDFIIGRVFLRAWPFTALAKISAPGYGY